MNELEKIARAQMYVEKLANGVNPLSDEIIDENDVINNVRIIRAISSYTNLNIESIKCNIVGEHGESQFPVWSRLAIAGVPMDEYCENVGLKWNVEHRNNLYNTVKRMGTDIISAKGKTHYGIATCVCSIADAILNQRLTIASVTTPLKGEYDIKDVSLSLPSIIGVNGVERRLEEHWTEEEYTKLNFSADKLKDVLKTIKK